MSSDFNEQIDTHVDTNNKYMWMIIALFDNIKTHI